MNPVSRLFVKTALLSLLLGMLGGAAFLVYKAAAGRDVPPALVVIHIHLLMVGFVVNMVMGVAYWMFPRTGEAPRGPRLPAMGFWLLNGGLWLRFLTEPFFYEPGGPLFSLGLAVSGAMQGSAALVLIPGLWQRVASPRERWEQDRLQRRGGDGGKAL